MIAEDAFVLAGPPGHPLLRRKRAAHPAELEGAQVLLLEDGHCFRDQALAICTRGNAQEAGFRATSLLWRRQSPLGAGLRELAKSLRTALRQKS